MVWQFVWMCGIPISVASSEASAAVLGFHGVDPMSVNENGVTAEPREVKRGKNQDRRK